jgi:Ca-activated chloride channel family protein
MKRQPSKIQNPKSKIRNSFLLFILPLLLAALACGGDDEGPPSNATVVEAVANTSLRPWLDSVVATFNASETESADGDPIFVNMTYLESGEVVSQVAEDQNSAPTLWIPDDQVWVSALADQGNNSFGEDCASVAESPLVIAMWRSVAEALGWPGLPLGWLDVGSLAADQAAWSYYSGGELGDALRLGHTHPGLSGSGAATLLALVHAAESKTEAVTVEDIQRPIVQASVGAFEGAVSWFSPSTDELGRTMSERGVEYLGAAVMYESTVVAYGNQQIVPIYPLEGTFVAHHPACLNSAHGDRTDPARLFRDYLLAAEAQQAAVTHGLRPVNDAVTSGAPLDAAHGIDLAQPAVVFNSPTVESLYAIQDVWQAARKPVNLVMLIDTSGSMRGEKIESARAAAVQFVDQMGEEDFITLISFASQPIILVDHEQVGPARDRIISIILDLPAEGDTALYDAIGDGATAIANTTSTQTTNALVVLSDGEDTFSYRYSFDQSLIDLARANDTTIFTIAYGGEASNDILADLALQANGKFFEGDAASIAAIYEEMSAAFGGSAGVGR